MSVQARQTRCPQCKTRFRVTEAQLAAAKGKVRCGQCRTVFNALEHLLAEPLPAARKATPPPAAPPSAPPATRPEPTPAADSEAPADADDELLFEDNPEEDATEKNYTGRGSALDEELSSSFLALEEEAIWHNDPQEVQKPGSADESWADSLLDDGDENWANSLLEDSTDHHGSNEAAATPSAAAETAGKPPEPASAEDDGWGELVDWDSLEDFTSPTDTPPAPAPEEPQPPARQDPPEPAPATAEPASPQASLAPEQTSGDWRLLQAEPIAASPLQTRHRLRWWWRGLALLLVAILVLQITWVQRDQLAANSLLRPFYSQACALLNCQLAPLVDRSQLASRDLVVRSHPDTPGALLVEARLHNRAGFPQPLPAVALSFSNLNGDIVAQRVFRPAEYLATDLSATEIGANRALPIRLSLQDPGREAINYRLDFLSLPQ